MKYTIYQAITIARELEALLLPLGAHCALGGSCLHKGGSEKDIDIFIYPHKNSLKEESIVTMLEEQGFNFEPPDQRYSIDVLVTKKGFLRVDFFFLSRH